MPETYEKNLIKLGLVENCCYFSAYWSQKIK